MTRTNDLRDRIRVERHAGAADAYGNVAGAWATVFEVWADMRETGGRERLRSDRLVAEATATIRVRATTSTRRIVETDRIVARGSVWEIRAIMPVENDRRWLEMLVERGQAG